MPKLRKPSPDVLDRIDQIRVVSWEWNDVAGTVGLEPGRREIGVIAQELAKIYPELVLTDAPDGFQQVNYGGLAAIAIAGVQQLRRELEQLRARLDPKRSTARAKPAARRRPAKRKRN